MEPDKQTDYTQPVAYDAEGRPLYAHPPTQPAAQPQQVHLSRPLEPAKPEVSEQAKARSEESQQLYPNLNLSDGEYVISAVRRHPIGLVIPLAVGTLIIAIALSLLVNFDAVMESSTFISGLSVQVAALPILLFSALVAAGMYIVYYVYINNKFFLTNESVIQEVQVSLFSRQEQTVSLANIEDASFTKEGIIQHIFNYGSIRLSTQGDETTYRFTFVADPDRHIATLNNAVEAFKNGRPVDSETK